jgi:hypothetical protein
MYIFALIFDLLVAISEDAGVASWVDDLDNRNGRGKLKKPSNKYVC